MQNDLKNIFQRLTYTTKYVCIYYMTHLKYALLLKNRNE